MPSNQCKATAKSTGEQCKNPPTPGHDVCRFHGSGSTGPRDTSETRFNGEKTGVRSDPTKLKDRLSNDESAFLTALVDGWLAIAPFDDTDARTERLETYGVMAIQERRGHSEILTDGITQERVVASDSEDNPVWEPQEHHLARFTSRLSKDVRQGLKDLGVLGEESARSGEDAAIIARFERLSPDADGSGD